MIKVKKIHQTLESEESGLSEKQRREVLEGLNKKPILDSGSRQLFESGAQRDIQKGKGRNDLLPIHGIMRVSNIFEGGAEKYGDDNCRLGMPLSRYMDSGLRHWFKLMMGYTDEDHAAQAAWNILMFMETKFLIEQGALPKELDDMKDFSTCENSMKTLSRIRESVSAFRKKKENS